MVKFFKGLIYLPTPEFNFPIIFPTIGIRSQFSGKEIFTAWRKDLEDGSLQVEKD